jgi:hypothetical protein
MPWASPKATVRFPRASCLSGGGQLEGTSPRLATRFCSWCMPCVIKPQHILQPQGLLAPAHSGIENKRTRGIRATPLYLMAELGVPVRLVPFLQFIPGYGTSLSSRVARLVCENIAQNNQNVGNLCNF